MFNKWLLAHWCGNQVYHMVQAQWLVLYQDCFCYYSQMPPVLKSWAQGWRDFSGQAGDRVSREEAWDEEKTLGSLLLTFPKAGISNALGSSTPLVLSLCIWEEQGSSLFTLPPRLSIQCTALTFSSLPTGLCPFPACSPVRLVSAPYGGKGWTIQEQWADDAN